MNLLIAYATNSGSTFEVANRLSEKLTEAGHQAEVKNIQEISDPSGFQNYDTILVGSPSWDYQGNEGHPHDDWMAFINNNQEADFGGKNFIIFGLGDETYEHFNGAVNHLEEYVNGHGGHLIADPLKINQYYNDMEAGNQAVDSWVNDKVLPALS